MAARRRDKPQRLAFDVIGQARSVLDEYLNYLKSHADDPEQTKLFIARHNAARAALTHVEALMKLDAGGRPGDQDQSSAMLAHARAALAQDKSENPSDDLEDEG